MKCFLAIILTLSCLPRLSQADEIHLLADEWCPYNCELEAEYPGYVIEIAKTIFKSAGHKVTYSLVPWQRAVLLTREGKFNAIVGAAETDAPDFIFPDNEQGELNYTFYTKSDNSWNYSDINSLANQVLGVINGYTYSEQLDSYIGKEKDKGRVQVAYEEDPLKQNIKSLDLERISVFIEDEMVTTYALTQLKQQHFFRKAGSLSRKNIYIAFSPTHPKSQEYAELLSEGMNDLRESGKLNKIMKKYALADWKLE